jgi:hypothetical protein
MNLNPALVAAPEGRVSTRGGDRRSGVGAILLMESDGLRPSSAAAPPEEQHQRRSPHAASQ